MYLKFVAATGPSCQIGTECTRTTCPGSCRTQ